MVQFPIREQLLRSIAKQFQEGSYLRLVDFCITQLSAESNKEEEEESITG